MQTLLEYVNICPERTFLTSDLGTAGLPFPDQAMLSFMRLLSERGVSQKHIDAMAKDIPAMLMNV